MPSSTQDVVTAALQLPEAERLSLANRLMRTLPDDLLDAADLDEDFEQELVRRSGECAGAVRWEDVCAELQRRL